MGAQPGRPTNFLFFSRLVRGPVRNRSQTGDTNLKVEKRLCAECVFSQATSKLYVNVEAGCCLKESPHYAHSVIWLGRGQKRSVWKSRNLQSFVELLCVSTCLHHSDKGPRRKHARCLCSRLEHLERYYQRESCTVWLGRRFSINPHCFTSFHLFHPHRSLAAVNNITRQTCSVYHFPSACDDRQT